MAAAACGIPVLNQTGLLGESLIASAVRSVQEIHRLPSDLAYVLAKPAHQYKQTQFARQAKTYT